MDELALRMQVVEALEQDLDIELENRQPILGHSFTTNSVTQQPQGISHGLEGQAYMG